MMKSLGTTTTLTYSLFRCLVYLRGNSVLFKTKLLTLPSNCSPPIRTMSYWSPPQVLSFFPNSINSLSEWLESQTMKSSFIFHLPSLPRLILHWKPCWYHVQNIICPLLPTSTDCTFPEYTSALFPSGCCKSPLSAGFLPWSVSQRSFRTLI